MERFIKNKDLFLKKIEQISRKEEMMIAKLKDGKEQAYLIESFLDSSKIDGILARLKDYELCSLVMYNTKENVDLIAKNWEKIANFKRHFSIHFINPFSRTEKRWSIYPTTHDLVTDKSNIRNSLFILFGSVESTTKEEIEKIVKSG